MIIIILNGKKYWLESTNINGDFKKFNFNIYEGTNDINESEQKTLKDIWDSEMQREPVIETEQGVIYLQPSEDGKFIQYGTVTNTGMLIDGEVEYDFDFSLDWNIQNVVDEIFEKYGYPLNEAAERYLSVEPDGIYLFEGEKCIDRLDYHVPLYNLDDSDIIRYAKKAFSNITDDIRVQWY